RLERAVFTELLDVVDAAENEHERWQKDEDCSQRRPGNSARYVAHKSCEQHERPRRRYTERYAIEQLAVGEPVILRNRSALHENERSVGTSETQQSCFEKQPGNLEQARIAELKQRSRSNKHHGHSWSSPFEQRRAALRDQVQ